MPLIRTPDSRFENLPGYPFPPHYVEVNGARMHYVDEGEGEIIVCLHGEPSWSYLYRKMIPPLAQHHRVVAPDLIGFGRSDKYTEPGEYTFQMHRDMVVGFFDALGLYNITLVVQDWGGLIGLRIVGEMPERFTRLVIMNTGLPDGTGEMPEALKQWREFAASNPDLPVGMVIVGGLTSRKSINSEIIAAYDAPFPDVSYKIGASVFPSLIPTTPDAPGADSMRQARQVLNQWAKPALIMFSDSDPITRGGDRFFSHLMPSAQVIGIEGAGHFLQEEAGETLAQHILDFIRSSASDTQTG